MQTEHATLQAEHATRLQCVCGARYAEGVPYLESGEQPCHFCVGDDAGQPAGLLLGRAAGPDHVAVRFDQGGGSYSWVHPRALPARRTPGGSLGEPRPKRSEQGRNFTLVTQYLPLYKRSLWQSLTRIAVTAPL